jgi:hypothetical protein
MAAAGAGVLAPCHGRQEGHFVALPKDGLGSSVLAVYRGRRHGSKCLEMRDFSAKDRPECGERRPFGKLAFLPLAPHPLPKRSEKENLDDHGGKSMLTVPLTFDRPVS